MGFDKIWEENICWWFSIREEVKFKKTFSQYFIRFFYLNTIFFSHDIEFFRGVWKNIFVGGDGGKTWFFLFDIFWDQILFWHIFLGGGFFVGGQGKNLKIFKLNILLDKNPIQIWQTSERGPNVLCKFDRHWGRPNILLK